MKKEEGYTINGEPLEGSLDEPTGYTVINTYRRFKAFLLYPPELLEIVSPAAAAVYGALRYVAGSSLVADATISDLSKITRQSERQVKRHIRNLWEAKLIKKVLLPGRRKKVSYCFLRHPKLEKVLKGTGKMVS